MDVKPFFYGVTLASFDDPVTQSIGKLLIWLGVLPIAMFPVSFYAMASMHSVFLDHKLSEVVRNMFMSLPSSLG